MSPLQKSPKRTFITGKEEEISETSEEEIIHQSETDETDVFKLRSDGRVINPHDIIDKEFVDVARINEGGSVGELSLTDGKPRFCTVKAITRTHLLSLSKQDFEKAKYETKRKRI